MNTDLKALMEWGAENGQHKGTLDRIVVDDRTGAVVLFDRSRRRLLGAKEIEESSVTSRIPFRGYEALTVESLVTMTRELAARVGSTKAAAFVSTQRITVALDEADRRDRVTMSLALSKTWDRIRLAKANPEDGDIDHDEMKQVELRAMLRREMDATYSPPDITRLISSVKFESKTDGATSVDTGKHAISRSIMAEMTGADALPDDVVVSAAVWDNVAIDGIPIIEDVRFGLDANPGNQTFRFRPNAGAVELAEQRAMERLVDVLRRELKGVASVYAASC